MTDAPCIERNGVLVITGNKVRRSLAGQNAFIWSSDKLTDTELCPLQHSYYTVAGHLCCLLQSHEHCTSWQKH